VTGLIPQPRSSRIASEKDAVLYRADQDMTIAAS
jgi:hypothetical protein